MMHTVLLNDAPLQPWRNGGGVTQELLAWPDTAPWQVRVSVARIDRDGPFSAFPGIDRWFAVLSGAGVQLGFGDEHQRMTPQQAPLHFDGADAPGCTLIDGATQDLNLMARQDAGRASMQVAQVGLAWHADASWRALFCTGAAHLQAGESGPTVSLPHASLVWTDQATPHTAWHLLSLAPGTRAWWLQFQAHRA